MDASQYDEVLVDHPGVLGLDLILGPRFPNFAPRPSNAIVTPEDRKATSGENWECGTPFSIGVPRLQEGAEVSAIPGFKHAHDHLDVFQRHRPAEYPANQIF
jgi:hypothetical protein